MVQPFLSLFCWKCIERGGGEGRIFFWVEVTMRKQWVYFVKCQQSSSIGSIRRSKPGTLINMTCEFSDEDGFCSWRATAWGPTKDDEGWQNVKKTAWKEAIHVQKSSLCQLGWFQRWFDVFLVTATIWIFTHRFLSINTLVSRSFSSEGMNFLDDHSNLASVLNTTMLKIARPPKSGVCSSTPSKTLDVLIGAKRVSIWAEVCKTWDAGVKSMEDWKGCL